jgi:hypothetical protein
MTFSIDHRWTGHEEAWKKLEKAAVAFAKRHHIMDDARAALARTVFAVEENVSRNGNPHTETAWTAVKRRALKKRNVELHFPHNDARYYVYSGRTVRDRASRGKLRRS